MKPHNLLIWLPSPLGDAIMAIPALRSVRALYPEASITLMAPAFTREVLHPCPYCDDWLAAAKGTLKTVSLLRGQSFDASILLKNSFGSALTVRLAGIGRRIGYAREGRSFLLTDKIAPPRAEDGSFKPSPMIEYYLEIAARLGGSTDARKPELTVEIACIESVRKKLPALNKTSGPLAVLVPGGAFGPSKLWPVQRYAQLADRLHAAYGATVFVSVAPVQAELAIAEQICQLATAPVVYPKQTALSGGELKALFGLADVVITNDTGPRHIAMALDRNVVSLFGPNNPQWTQTGHAKEIQIIGQAPCVPCEKPVCRQSRHLCMESITVEAVFEAAGRFLETR